MRRVAAVTAMISAFLSTVLSLDSAAHAQRGNPVLTFAGQSIDEMVGEFMRDHAVADPVAVERGHPDHAAQLRRRSAIDAALLHAVSP